MPSNALITGPPRSGKSTVIQRTVDRLVAEGYQPGGIYCPEIRDDGTRVGFSIVDLYTDDSRVLAHVDDASGPSVGTYRVSVENVDEICHSAFDVAFSEADVLVVDEIAPMELKSEVFVREVKRAVKAELPLIAAIHERSRQGLIGWVKDRPDVDRFEVTPATRDDLPPELVAWVRSRIA